MKVSKLYSNVLKHTKNWNNVLHNVEYVQNFHLMYFSLTLKSYTFFFCRLEIEIGKHVKVSGLKEKNNVKCLIEKCNLNYSDQVETYSICSNNMSFKGTHISFIRIQRKFAITVL